MEKFIHSVSQDSVMLMANKRAMFSLINALSK